MSWRTVARAACVVGLLSLWGAGRLEGQTLRDQLVSLFVFGDRSAPLEVLAPADPNDPSAGAVPTDAFEAGAVQANAAVLTFILNWMTGTVANMPIGSTSGGAVFRFERGVPVKTPLSRGPIFGERGNTLGRNRVMVGATFNHIAYTSVRGASMSNLGVNFTHRDAGSTECAGGASESCNDVIAVKLAVDQTVWMTSLFATYGLFSRMDVGVVLPFVRNDLHARSDAQVIPFGTAPGGGANTFFAGTPSDPVLVATRAVRGTATGLGDVVVRGKIGIIDLPDAGLALVGDIRFPTGDEAELLGSGHQSERILGAFSARFGPFTPNASVGYLHWKDGPLNNAVIATVGFDQLIAPWATLAFGVLSETHVGRSIYQLPPAVTLRQPFTRTVTPFEIPNARDDALDASMGAKLSIPGGGALVINALLPVTRGGPRPDFVWTFGLEQGF